MFPLQLFSSTRWQMALGERAAIEGVLGQLKPQLALEIGTAEGGSLERIASHSKEVHSFDFSPRVDPAEFPNVTFHRGDQHENLPRVLRELERQGRNVDFVLVDGDHSFEGVRRDVEDLLQSSAVSRTVILLHDCLNEGVRRGIESAPFERHPKVVYVDLNLVPTFQDVKILGEIWGGLGIIVVDAEQVNYRIFDETIIVRDRIWSTENVVLWRLASPYRGLRRRVRRTGGKLLRQWKQHHRR